MYGFNVIIGAKGTESCKARLQYRNVIFESNMIDKFQDDKLFFEDDNYLIVLDGVTLNKQELCNEGKSDWGRVFVKMYETDGEKFFSKLRGSFSGAVYDKRKERLIVFSDQIGSRFIYYAKNGDSFICSSMMPEMYHIMKTNNMGYKLSKTGAMCLLTYGYMLDDITLCNEVRKIIPGDYLIYENGKAKTATYYTIEKHPDDKITKAEAIELIDKSFRQAVKRQFEKDCEYGYRHLTALSGGLDSRMTTWVAHDLGYTDQVNFTFSQTDYWDEIVPKQITADLKHEWIFKALDNGLWLKEIDRITQRTGGNAFYIGTAHGDSCSRCINFDEFGLIHTGQIGDVIISSFVTVKNNGKYKMGDGAYSKKYIDRLNVSLREYEDREIAMIYVRGFNGANSGLQNTYNYTETLSPFLDLDFLDACFSIPLKYREYHKIYKKWILAKYPKAAEYVWERMKCRITAPTINVAGGIVPLQRIIPLALKHLKKKNYTDTKKNMNPVGYYMKHNQDLSEYIDSYFQYKTCIEDDDLLKIIEDVEKRGTSMEKLQIASLSGAVKLYYI